MFGSFLPSLGRHATKVYSGRGSRHCYEIKCQPPALDGVGEKGGRQYPVIVDWGLGPQTTESFGAAGDAVALAGLSAYALPEAIDVG
jgi:hypothetical protein